MSWEGSGRPRENEGAPTAVASAEGRPRVRISTFRAFGYRNFRFLWLGQVSNSAAIWTEQVARPLLIVALIPDPAAAAIHLGAIQMARTIPQLFFGLIGGVLADWFDRRWLLLLSKTPYMTVNFIFALIILSGNLELWHVYATTILKAFLTSFDQPARQALIPSLVASEDVPNAVALNQGSMTTMRIGGAPLAALLVVLFDFGVTFLFVALFSGMAVIFTYLMRVPPPDFAGEKNLTAGVISLKEGIAYAWHDLNIRAAIVLTMAYFLLGMAYLQVFAPLLATHVMGIGKEGYGAMISVAGIGGALGLVVIASTSPTTNRGPIMLVLMTLLGVFLIGFGGSTYGFPLAVTFGFIALVGMVQSTFNALATTVLIMSAPVEMRGRIMGLLSLDRATIAGGGMLAGFLAAVLGPQMAQMPFGVGCIVFALILATVMPHIRKLQ